MNTRIRLTDKGRYHVQILRLVALQEQKYCPMRASLILQLAAKRDGIASIS